MHQTAPNAEEIFLAALEIEEAEARSSYLDEACGDPELRRHVEHLLALDARSGGFLDSPASAPTLTVESPSLAEGPGTVIGPYELMEQIGEGGMGTVHMAEQAAPIRRRVALKVIKPGMDTKQVIARFEAERQALAMMDHPNIAKVLDAGATPSGRPYFVMELVRGVPITEFCDSRRLTIRERLELFVLVCRAVQHAHQKGVIHRDLKPSNILVTLHDGVPVPKVIDFGIAKATGAALTAGTVYTGFAQLLGTPLYMSPEQVEMSGLDVDTRSDLYSLGVLLYELLTGTTPFDSEALRRVAFDEMRRMIREDEPPRPSTRLGTLGATLSTVSARRRADPRRLAPSLRGELDWVVMKALEKDRRRRYETAGDFAADVSRHLRDQPVEARPPTGGYRLRKFARRNRVAFTTAALVALALAAGTGVSIWQAMAASRARAKALASATEARQQREITDWVNTFFLKDLLGQASVASQDSAGGGLDPDIKVRTLLDRAAARISTRFAGRPVVEAAIRQTISDQYRALSLYREALPHQERALDLRRRVLGPHDHETLTSQDGLAMLLLGLHRMVEAETLLVATLEAGRRRFGPEDPLTLGLQHDLALVYQEREKSAEAERLLLATLEARTRVLGPEEDATLATRNNLAELYRRQGRLAEAEPQFRATLAAQRRRLPPDHPETLATQNNLALVCDELGKTGEAESLLRDTLEAARRLLGPQHVHTLTTLETLATIYEAEGKFAEAEPLCREMVAHWRTRTDSEGTINSVDALERLGRILLLQEKYAEAEGALRECVAICDAKGLRGSGRFQALGLLGGALLGQQDYAGAEPILLESYEGMNRIKLTMQVNMPSAVRARDQVVERLVYLYEAIDRKDAAAAWRERRSKAGGAK